MTNLSTTGDQSSYTDRPVADPMIWGQLVYYYDQSWVSDMSYEHEPVSPMFRIDVSADAKAGKASQEANPGDLLKQLVEGQRQQNILLEELLHQQVAANKQRATELQQWKKILYDYQLLLIKRTYKFGDSYGAH